ncbi:MAG: SDR family NAD(P)-dependent oxidoreductase [Polyangiaceae bacterium]
MSKKTSKPGFSGVRDPSLEWIRHPAESLDLTGKNVLVVGGTNGLGRAIARLVAARGAKVTVVGQTFRDADAPNIDFVKADLSRMAEATRVGATLPVESTDVVLLTTGIIAAPKREVTSEGLERDMAVSYLSRLALLRALAPRLGTSLGPGAPKPRVFVMGFPGTGEAGKLGDLNAERSYKSMEVHMNTVAGNEALVLDSVERYPHASFFGLNPGLVKTGIRANVLGGHGSLRHRAVEFLIGLFTPTPEKYAGRIVPLLFAPELEGRTGVMFNQKAHAIRPTEALTPTRVAALIEESEQLIARTARTPRVVEARSP